MRYLVSSKTERLFTVSFGEELLKMVFAEPRETQDFSVNLLKGFGANLFRFNKYSSKLKPSPALGFFFIFV
jgi:hypothetical protein